MSLAAALQSGPPPTRKGPRCSVGVILDSLPDQDSQALQDALDARHRWTAEQIAELIRTEVKTRIMGQTVARHRRGACSCEPC